MRIETIGNATLYLGDCLGILPTLDKVDAVITDPPYEQSNSGGGLVAKRKTHQTIGSDLSKFEFNKYWPFLRDASRTNHGYIFSSKGCLGDFCAAVNIDKLNWDLLIYSKLNPIPMKNNRYLSSFECLFFFRGNGSYWNNDAPMSFYSKIKKTVCKSSEYGHPTEKDTKVIDQLLTISTKQEHSIIDPFMGSGTTGVACINLGRKFIGIEIEEKYFDIACERIQAAQNQGRLFA